MKNVIKNENFSFRKKYRRYEINIGKKIVHPKKIFKFTSNYLLTGQVVSVLIVKNVIKNEKFHFAPNLCEIRKKFCQTKLFV